MGWSRATDTHMAFTLGFGLTNVEWMDANRKSHKLLSAFGIMLTDVCVCYTYNFVILLSLCFSQ